MYADSDAYSRSTRTARLSGGRQSCPGGRGRKGNLFQGAEPGLGHTWRGGILVEQFKNPDRRDILGDGGQFGKDAS
jgi:hypothetical protein